MAKDSEIRVKLSAEGVEDVVKALKKVERQAKSSGDGAKKGIGAFNSALGDLDSLIPTIGVGALVAGLGALVKRSLDAADAVGKLSAKTGVTAETISVFSVGAKTADVEFSQLESRLIKFNKTMGDLDRGSKESAQAVRLLFGSAKSLDGLDTEARLLKVTQALGKMGEGFKKTRAAQDFFGKSGADIIPLLNDLAGEGFDQIKGYAEQTGQIVTSEFANAAQRANDSIQRIKDSAGGLATSFASGLAPAIGDIADELLNATASGKQGLDGMAAAGELVGNVFKGVAAAFIVVGKTLGYWFAYIGLQIDRVTESAKALVDVVSGDVGFGEANRQLGARFSQQSSDLKASFFDDVGTSMENLFNPARKVADRGETLAGGGGSDQQIADRKRLADAAIALEKQRINALLEIQKRGNALMAIENENAYRNGEKSLEQYWMERQRIAELGISDEQAALEAELQQARRVTVAPGDDAAAVKKAQDIKAIEEKINLLAYDRKKIEAEITQGRREGTEKIRQQEADLRIQLLEGQGRYFEASRAAIAAQAEQYRAAGIDPSLVSQFEAMATRRADFAEQSERASAALASVGAVYESIEIEEMAGQLFPFEAAEKYRIALQEMLPELEAIAKAKLAAATTDEEREAAEETIRQVQRLGVEANKAGQQMAKFKADMQAALTSDLTDFLANGITEAKSFGEAMRGLASSVVASLRRIASEMLATYAIQKLIGFGQAIFGGNPSGGLNPGAGKTVMVADGGMVTGPGTGTSDSIPARLSNGEFVVNAGAVAQPGVLDLLRQINAGSSAAALRGIGGVARFAAGGMVGGISPATTVNRTSIVNVLDPSLMQQYLTTTSGEKAILNVIKANPNMIRRLS